MNGILIGIEPVVLKLGSVTVRWFGICLVLALISGLGLTAWRGRRQHVPFWETLDIGSWALLAGLVGARLLHVIEHWEFYFTRPAAVIDLSSGGFNIWGGWLAGAAVVWRLARRRSSPELARLADAAAPALLVAEMIGRVGCFLNGDGQGIPSDLPWATLYASSNAMTPDFGIPRHPAQLYQALADALALGIVLAVARWRPEPGVQFRLAATLYGLSRLVIGAVRTDPIFAVGLQLGQLIGLAVAALASASLLRAVAGRRPRAAFGGSEHAA